MSSYDFAAAEDFLLNEIETSPEELYEEIQEAMHQVTLFRNKRNKKAVHEIYSVLLTCADLVECMSPHSPEY